MRKAVPRLFALLIIPLGVVFLYALVHEASHALVVFLVGGEVTRFQVNFLQHAPSISYTGVSDPLHKAFISLAGPVLPLALVPFVAVVLRKTRSALAQAAFVPLAALPPHLAATPWFMVGAVPPRKIWLVLHYTGANPFLQQLFFCCVCRSAGVCVQGGRARVYRPERPVVLGRATPC